MSKSDVSALLVLVVVALAVVAVLAERRRVRAARAQSDASPDATPDAAPTPSTPAPRRCVTQGCTEPPTWPRPHLEAEEVPAVLAVLARVLGVELVALHLVVSEGDERRLCGRCSARAEADLRQRVESAKSDAVKALTDAVRSAP